MCVISYFWQRLFNLLYHSGPQGVLMEYFCREELCFLGVAAGT